jgi:abhydrolase domain-containing protein 17
MVLSNIINYFLFKPPPSQPYTFTNDVVKLKQTKQGNDTQIATTILERKSAKTTILYSHGNAEDLSVIFPYLLKLAFELDSNVVSYDYNGYGESTGTYLWCNTVYYCVESNIYRAFG